jgi:hypothetical protein
VEEVGQFPKFLGEVDVGLVDELKHDDDEG